MPLIAYTFIFPVFKKCLFIFERERNREREIEHELGRGRERGRQNLKQAPGSELVSTEPDAGLKLTN